MTEFKPIVKCTERIYEIINAGKITKIKSTKPISSENVVDILLKEDCELLNFIEKYEVLETSNILVSPQLPEYSKQNLIEKSSLIKDVKNEENMDLILPKIEEVIEYITTKELYKHDTVELQEKFLGKRVLAKENRKYFSSFDNILRRARKKIADKHNITWDKRETKSYDNRTHVTVYQIKKSTEEHTPNSLLNRSNTLNNILVQDLIPLAEENEATIAK